jgi:hypothetical protein
MGEIGEVGENPSPSTASQRLAASISHKNIEGTKVRQSTREAFVVGFSVPKLAIEGDAGSPTSTFSLI